MKAGRNDTFMATCLPFCDEFVSRDESMLTCYREVVAVAGLEVTVHAFEEFIGQFSIGRVVNRSSLPLHPQSREGLLPNLQSYDSL